MKVVNGLGKRGIATAAALVLSTAFLAACGSGEEDDDRSGSATDVVCEVSPTDKEIAEAKDFYDGETITFVVDRSPGGGYDQYARLVAPYLADELGATVVVENQEGAGGLVAMNALAAKKPTGLDIAIFNAPGLLPATVAGFEGVRFEPTELTWLGRVGGEATVLVVPEESPFERFEDLMAAEDIKFGSSGPGAADYVNPSLLIGTLDLDAKVVTGYDGSSEIELGLLRGDTDAMTGSLDSRMGAINNGSTRPLLAISSERVDELPDTPTILEQDLDDSQRAVFETHIAVDDIGRPIVAPPGLDAGKTHVLREALSAALANPKLLKESEKIKRPILALPGDEQCVLAQNLLEVPDTYRKLLEEAYRGGSL